MLLHRAIGEVAKKSLQLTRIEDEIKESHQMLNMHQGGGRGGVRRGGQNRVQVQSTQYRVDNRCSWWFQKECGTFGMILCYLVQLR